MNILSVFENQNRRTILQVLYAVLTSIYCQNMNMRSPNCNSCYSTVVVKIWVSLAWNSTKTLLTKKLLIISSHAFSRLVDRYVMISDLVFHWLVVFFMTGLFSEESSLVSN